MFNFLDERTTNKRREWPIKKSYGLGKIVQTQLIVKKEREIRYDRKRFIINYKIS